MGYIAHTSHFRFFVLPQYIRLHNFDLADQPYPLRNHFYQLECQETDFWISTFQVQWFRKEHVFTCNT
jgi:hypothetical protein